MLHSAYLTQPFSLTKTEKWNGWNIWKWDGNRENPTLNPSFLVDFEMEKSKMHLFVRNGNLQILSDTTIDCKDVFKETEYDKFFGKRD